MSAVFYNDTLPWSPSAEDRQRLRRSMTAMLAAVLLMSIVIPLVKMPAKLIDRTPEVPPRFAQLIVREKPVPPPPPPQPVQREEAKPPQAKPEPKPEPRPEPKPESKKAAPVKAEPAPAEKRAPAQPDASAAREKAARTGLLALSNELTALRTESAAADMDRRRIQQRGAGDAPRTERSIITAGGGKGSGGIDTSKLSRDAGDTRLASRSTTHVEAPADALSAAAGAQGRGGASGSGGQRSSEEIQMVFDSNKGALNAIYNRALRANPALAGKIVLKLTIDPSGKVTACELVSSQLGDPELEHRLLARVQMFDFGAKKVGATTITYPIDFFPG